MKNLIIILPCVLLLSCSKGGDDRLAEQADIQAREQYQAQNENQKMWRMQKTNIPQPRPRKP